VEALRTDGYQIDARTRIGYKLLSRPDRLTTEEVRHFRSERTSDLPLRCSVQVTSTNQEARVWAMEGAPHGAAVVAEEQTTGRGRYGRPFHSPPNAGLYVSLILRPDWPSERLPLLTIYVAEAACDALESVTGRRPQVKWVNDLLMGGRKLAGILTELSIVGENGQMEFAIIGIGLNCHDVPFPEELQNKATSLETQLGRRINRAELTAALLDHLYEMAENAGPEKYAMYLERYRNDCVTTGQQVAVTSVSGVRTGWATAIADNGALIVRFDDGHTEAVSSGEVTLHSE
jgi:BirA family biotin operon repressor/biotin-[acetyl-CoA-carboxylase] ligase